MKFDMLPISVINTFLPSTQDELISENIQNHFSRNTYFAICDRADDETLALRVLNKTCWQVRASGRYSTCQCNFITPESFHNLLNESRVCSASPLKALSHDTSAA